MLAWLCGSDVQMICICYSWCYCHLIISEWFIFLVPAYPGCPGKKWLLNGCSNSSSSSWWYCCRWLQLHFISPYVNSGTASPASGPLSVFAYIGTPPALRRQSRLLWRQGPCYLIEDVVAFPVIQALYRLGPNYIGSLQAPGAPCTC